MDASNTAYLDVFEAAAYMRKPVSTLRHWRFVGVGPRSFKIGRRVFYKVADLDGWLAQQYEATVTA